jgi:outer membrane protein OmpA-like peptidoglycan-associated protein
VWQNTVTGDTAISSARQAPWVNVSTRTLDGFAPGTNGLPAAGAATVAKVVADPAANPLAIVRIVGFTHASDELGSQPLNVLLARLRAERVRDAIIAAGATGGRLRFHVFGWGKGGSVAPDDTAAQQANSRRVVTTVVAPGP